MYAPNTSKYKWNTGATRTPKKLNGTSIADIDSVAAYIMVIMIVPANTLPKIRNESDIIGTNVVIMLIGKNIANGDVYLLKYFHF